MIERRNIEEYKIVTIANPDHDELAIQLLPSLGKGMRQALLELIEPPGASEIRANAMDELDPKYGKFTEIKFIFNWYYDFDEMAEHTSNQVSTLLESTGSKLTPYVPLDY